MTLLNIIIIFMVIGFVLWLINSYLPMDGKVKTILNVVVVFAIVLWLLKAFGFWHTMTGIHF